MGRNQLYPASPAVLPVLCLRDLSWHGTRAQRQSASAALILRALSLRGQPRFPTVRLAGCLPAAGWEGLREAALCWPDTLVSGPCVLRVHFPAWGATHRPLSQPAPAKAAPAPLLPPPEGMSVGPASRTRRTGLLRLSVPVARGGAQRFDLLA